MSYIVQAMQELPQAQIMASWEITEIPVVLFGSKKNRPSRLDAYKLLQTHLHTSSGAIFLDDEGSDEINTSSIGNAEGDINIIEENENSTASATIERSAPGEKRNAADLVRYSQLKNWNSRDERLRYHESTPATSWE